MSYSYADYQKDMSDANEARKDLVSSMYLCSNIFGLTVL